MSVAVQHGYHDKAMRPGVAHGPGKRTRSEAFYRIKYERARRILTGKDETPEERGARAQREINAFARECLGDQQDPPWR